VSLIQLNIKGISYSQSRTGAYALIMTEIEGERTLPIVIGAFEAQAIAIALESEITPPRPLTHDLFVAMADLYNIKLKQVIIHKLVDGVFYSSLICERDKVEEIIDSRTSDAIALAVRFDTPIYTYENILEKAGIDMKGENFIQEQQEFSEEEEDFLDDIFAELEDITDSIENLSNEELQNKLEEAIANEDYEEAASLRDEIDKREKA